MDLGVVHSGFLSKSTSKIKSKRTASSSTGFEETGDVGRLTRSHEDTEAGTSWVAFVPSYKAFSASFRIGLIDGKEGEHRRGGWGAERRLMKSVLSLLCIRPLPGLTQNPGDRQIAGVRDKPLNGGIRSCV